MNYDKNNIFAKIIRGEIPCKKILENEHALAFHDIYPKTKVHALVIPKGEYCSFEDFMTKAKNETIYQFFKAVQETAEILQIQDSGYRIISNHGPDSRQEVPHFHVHIHGGEKLDS